MPASTRFLVYLLIGILGIAVLHIAAVQFALYWSLWWLDILMHLAGGAWIALAAAWTVRRFGWRWLSPARADQWMLLGVGMTLIVGIGWEVFEVWAGVPVGGETYALDTGIDLTADVIGAFAAMVSITHLLTPPWLYASGT